VALRPHDGADEVARTIARIRAGEVELYAELVRRHRQEVLRVVVLMLADPARTESIVQQAFVNAYEALGSFRPGEDFGRWLRTIARNLVRDELRRLARERGHLALYREHVLATLEGADHGERREQALAQALAECRTRLAPTASTAIQLRYDQERSFDEIAAALGRRTDAVRQIVTRARVVLKLCIEKKLAEP
jgi:RNA polymerase sigma-70 factor (ECF subfamily)